MARIHLLAIAISDYAPRLDYERIKGFVHAFQNLTTLNIGELWALPLMLRLTVMETLANGLAELTNQPWESSVEVLLWKTSQDASRPDAEAKVINSILNLRLIAKLERKEFFEATSVLEEVLSRDPAAM